MAKGKKKEEKPLYRAVRFEIFPSPQDVEILYKVSQNLSLIWNEALKERQECFEKNIKPIYEKIAAAKKKAEEAGASEVWKENLRKTINKLMREKGFLVRFTSEKESLLLELKTAFAKHKVTLYDQINSLTAKRLNEAFAFVPRNWQEETLDSLDGSFKSFLSLCKNGDMDANPPGERDVENHFYKIPGRYGFKIANGKLVLSFPKLDYRLTLDIPTFQMGKLGAATKLKKFELYRDERNMAKPGRFWVSIVYEVEKPISRPLLADNTVYLAVGASRLGVISPNGSFCLNLPRPDFHWKPNINNLEDRLKHVVKGSRKWKRLISARAKMFSKMSHQQKHGQYEVVRDLLKLGTHFVVTDLKVRSKENSLADASKANRGGSPFGANWSAQNTGNIGRFIQKLTDKAQERGGTVLKRQPPKLSLEERQLPEKQQKILIAEKLREEFLAEHR